MLVQNLILNSGLNCLVKPLAISNGKLLCVVFVVFSCLILALFCPLVLLNWSQVRYRKAIYFRKYHQPDFRQKLLLAACEPVYAIDRRPESEKCFNLTPHPPKPDHPYDILLAKDMTAELESSALVCFFHQNQMSSIDRRLVMNEFTKEGMTLRYYNRDIARLACANTRYAPLLHFAVGLNFTVLFAPTTEKILKIKRIAKKYSEILLLGAMVDRRRLLTVEQLDELALMGDLDTQRAMLTHTLTVSQQGLLQSLNHHSSTLSRLLKTHANPNEDQVEGAKVDEPKAE